MFSGIPTPVIINWLTDSGANCGLARSDMFVIDKTGREINILGIYKHELTSLDVVTAASLLKSNQGKVIGIFHEYSYLGKGSSIHDDKSINVGGTQCLQTLEGYALPLSIKEGLAYMTSLGPLTDQDLKSDPHAIFTSSTWDTSLLDHEYC